MRSSSTAENVATAVDHHLFLVEFSSAARETPLVSGAPERRSV
jgi:hypothetical protein